MDIYIYLAVVGAALKCSVLLASHHAINKSKQMNVRTDICPAKPLTCVVRR